MSKEKVVLAYSGGLDTSIMIRWLIDTYDLDVIAMCANLGQAEELAGLEEKALRTGAIKCFIEDLRDEFVTDYIYPTVQAGAIYERYYLLGTSFGRPLIAKRMVEIAQQEGATSSSAHPPLAATSAHDAIVVPSGSSPASRASTNASAYSAWMASGSRSTHAGSPEPAWSPTGSCANAATLAVQARRSNARSMSRVAGSAAACARHADGGRVRSAGAAGGKWARAGPEVVCGLRPEQVLGSAGRAAATLITD